MRTIKVSLFLFTASDLVTEAPDEEYIEEDEDQGFFTRTRTRIKLSLFLFTASDLVTEAPDEEFVEEDESKGFFQDNKKITFYLVCPLFVFCYGGSCLVYAIGKGYK